MFLVFLFSNRIERRPSSHQLSLPAPFSCSLISRWRHDRFREQRQSNDIIHWKELLLLITYVQWRCILVCLWCILIVDGCCNINTLIRSWNTNIRDRLNMKISYLLFQIWSSHDESGIYTQLNESQLQNYSINFEKYATTNITRSLWSLTSICEMKAKNTTDVDIQQSENWLQMLKYLERTSHNKNLSRSKHKISIFWRIFASCILYSPVREWRTSYENMLWERNACILSVLSEYYSTPTFQNIQYFDTQLY